MNWLWTVGAALGGMLMGGLYFGGLWWTVRRLPRMQQPALWFGLSFLVRNAVVLAGFYLLMAGRWERLIAALAGFVLARVLVVRMTTTDIPNPLTMRS